MIERRRGERYVIAFPVRAKWKDADGREVVEDGLTENVGPNGTLVYLPRTLPDVGAEIELTVREEDEVTVMTSVIRLERNAAHPQVALNVSDGFDRWQNVWELARRTVAGQKPDEYEEW